jgi:hypothetical protein
MSFKGNDKVFIDGEDTGLTVDDLVKYAVAFSTEEENLEAFEKFVEKMTKED